MASEEGIVIRVDQHRAWVKTIRSTACESCASKKACQGLGGGDEMEVETLNRIGAGVGDRVQIRFDTGKLIWVSFLLYIFPILCMMIGAVVGQKFAGFMKLGESAASALCGFAFFGLAFGIIRWGSGVLARKKDYQPQISRIVLKAVQTHQTAGG